MKDSETIKNYSLKIRQPGIPGNSCILWFKNRDIDMERYDDFLARLPQGIRQDKRARMYKLIDKMNADT